jgi:hypothetical protein
MGGVVDVAELAEPLDVGTRKVALLKAASEVGGTWAVRVEHGVKHFGSTLTVIERETVFEITVMIDEAVSGTAGGSESL